MSDSVANGESKLKTVANPTNGDVVVVAKGNGGVVANSQICHSNDKTSTTPIDLAKVAQSLQIMRDCIDMARDDGIATEIATFTSKSGKLCVLVVLQDVKFENDDFIYVGRVASGK